MRSYTFLSNNIALVPFTVQTCIIKELFDFVSKILQNYRKNFKKVVRFICHNNKTKCIYVDSSLENNRVFSCGNIMDSLTEEKQALLYTGVPVGQLVEQNTNNVKVMGSVPKKHTSSTHAESWIPKYCLLNKTSKWQFDFFMNY